MPMYEYRCNGCKREFEIQQRMSDDDLVKCEVCGEDKLEKLISWSAFGSSNAGLYSSNPKAALSNVVRSAPPKKEVPAPVVEPAPENEDDEPSP